MPRGLLIAIEGIDGTGKTTMISNLKNILDKKPEYEKYKNKVIFTKEPYNYNEVKQKLKTETDPEVILKIFIDDYLIHLKEQIYPALNDGKIIITDRYIESRIAYQSAMMCKDVHKLDETIDFIKNKHPIIVEPDFTILLRAQPETIKHRLSGRKDATDIENKVNMKLVENVYLKLLESKPDKHFVMWTDGCARCISNRIMKKLATDIFSKI